MSNCKILQMNEELVCNTPVPFYEMGISCGLPSEMGDIPPEMMLVPGVLTMGRTVSFVIAEGDSMIGLGICEDDIAVIDRSIEAQHGDIIVAFINNEFNIKLLDLTHQKEGFIELKSANPKYPSFRIDEDDQFEVWGVVVYTIKKWK